MPERPPEDLLNAADLAQRLGLKPDTVRDWYRRGRIPGLKLSPKVLRFDLAAVLAALGTSEGREGGGR